MTEQTIGKLHTQQLKWKKIIYHKEKICFFDGIYIQSVIKYLRKNTIFNVSNENGNKMPLKRSIMIIFKFGLKIWQNNL